MRAILITVLVILSTMFARAQDKMAYENRNQIDYELVVRRIGGRVTDAQGVPVPGVDIGVFTESEHNLVSQSATDSDGHFKIEQLPRGEYRFVARYYPLCSANAQIKVAAWPKGGVLKARELRVTMIPGGIDECSSVSN